MNCTITITVILFNNPIYNCIFNFWVEMFGSNWMNKSINIFVLPEIFEDTNIQLQNTYFLTKKLTVIWFPVKKNLLFFYTTVNLLLKCLLLIRKIDKELKKITFFFATIQDLLIFKTFQNDWYDFSGLIQVKCNINGFAPQIMSRFVLRRVSFFPDV
jgi:hypothetical protein